MNIKHYISAAMLALVGLGFTACDGKDEPDYTPAAKPSDAERVYFAQPKISKIVTVDETEVLVPVYRPEANSESALTVQILATYAQEADAQIFHVAPEVTFEENQAFAQIAVTYDANAMTPNTPYSINIAIDEANADVYGIASTELVLNYEVMTDWALFKGTTEEQDGYGSFTIGSPYSSMSFSSIRVFERHIPSDPNQIEFIMQLYDGEEEDEAAIPHDDDFNNPEWIDVWNFSTTNGGKTIVLPIQEFVLDPSISMAEASVLYPNSFDNESSFDPVSGIFTINVMCFDEEGAWNPAPWYINLNGYADTNVYTLSITDKGQVNVGDKDYIVIDFQLSETLSFVNYTVVELPAESTGLTEEEVEDVVSGIVYMDQSQYTIQTVTESGNVTMTFPSSGTYEIVAVGFKKGNDGSLEGKVIETCVFNFETFDPYAGWTELTSDAVYVDNLFSAVFGQSLEQTLTVRIDKSDDFEGVYRIVNPYAESPYVEAAGCTLAPFGSIEYVVTEDGIVYFPYSATGILEEGTDWEICSYSYYMLDNDVDPANIPAAFWGTYNNGKVTLDAVDIDNAASFLLFIGQSGYYANMDFSLDMNGGAAEAPAKKAIGKLTRSAMHSASVKAPVFPARFKATFNSAKTSVKAGKPTIVAKNRRR